MIGALMTLGIEESLRRHGDHDDFPVWRPIFRWISRSVTGLWPYSDQRRNFNPGRRWRLSERHVGQVDEEGILAEAFRQSCRHSPRNLVRSCAEER